MIVSVSLDPKDSWSNGIWQNSRHTSFTLEFKKGSWVLDNYNGSSKLQKLRKFSTPDADKIEKKIQELPTKLAQSSGQDSL